MMRRYRGLVLLVMMLARFFSMVIPWAVVGEIGEMSLHLWRDGTLHFTACSIYMCLPRVRNVISPPHWESVHLQIYRLSKTQLHPSRRRRRFLHSHHGTLKDKESL
jgi:hypothetical protein